MRYLKMKLNIYHDKGKKYIITITNIEREYVLSMFFYYA